MKPTVTIEYHRNNGHWTWSAQIVSNGERPIRATGDLYPGNQKGLRAAKRDAAAAVAHLRQKGNIMVKRGRGGV